MGFAARPTVWGFGRKSSGSCTNGSIRSDVVRRLLLMYMLRHPKPDRAQSFKVNSKTC